jgi:D-amino peptidase
MKIYISADIEGIGCIVRQEQSSPDGREYRWARKMMTAEVNSAIRGAFDGGAGEVVVADSHNVGLNLIPEELDARASLIMGSPRPLCMMDGIHLGFDAAFLVGYHGKAGTADSNLVHIFNRRIAEVRVNGIDIGEIGMSAGLAGFYGTPVALITGDDQAVGEAAKLLPGVETVEVKKAIGAYAARCLLPDKTRALIYEGARRTMTQRSAWPLFRVDPPVELTMRFTTTSAVDRVLRMPGIERQDGLTARFAGKDFLDAFKAFNTMADLIELVAYI